MMEAVDPQIEEIDVPCTPSPRTKDKNKNKRSTLTRSPSSGGSSPPESPTHNKSGMTNGDDNNAEDSGGGQNSQTSPLGALSGKLPSLQLKKQYSKIFRIKTKVIYGI